MTNIFRNLFFPILLLNGFFTKKNKPKIFIITWLLIQSTFSIQAQLFTDPPSRSPTFYCSCQGGGAPTGVINFNRYKHYIKTSMGQNITIAQFCNYVEFAPSFKVAADGGESFIVIDPECNFGSYDLFGFMDEPSFDLNEFANGDFETNGKFTVEFRGLSRLELKYQHPTKLPIGKTLEVYPSLGFFLNTITIYHPPVAMIHGLWADRSSFDDMESDLLASGLYEPWQLYKIDYKSSNDRSFFNNQTIPQVGIDQVLGQCWDNFMAVSKANVVGHSMGGLLTRKFVQGPFYNQYKTVNKIITCNTPHQGSQMANWLLDNSSVGGSAAATALDFLGMSSYNGAVNDLRVGSSAIVGIQSGTPQNPVKVHSINTVQPHTAGLNGTYFGTVFGYMLYQIVNTCGGNYITDIFDSTDSDIVVALESQAGGLSGLQTELYNNQVHVGSVANPQVMNAVRANLALDNTDPAFASQFNSQTLGYSLGATCLFNTANPTVREAKISTASLQITAPTAGQNVTSGSNLSISFTSTDVDSVAAYLPHTHQNFAIKKVKFSNNSFTLPTELTLLGPIKLVLIGYSPTKEIVATANVIYNQTTNAILESIYVYPTTVNLHLNDSLAISVYGKYSDGMDRDITESDLLSFSFANGHASKVGNNIVLHDTENDVLEVSENIASARKAGVLFDPINVKINTLDPAATALPLNLLSFTGKVTENGNLLDWKTASESNFSHFEIEKSINNSLKFNKIGTIKGGQNESYQFIDKTQLSNEHAQINYYRLKMIDLDGKYNYSKIIAIQNIEQTDYLVYPNPFSKEIFLENKENKSLKISLFDQKGGLLQQFNSSNNKINLDIFNKHTGLYFLQINDGVKIKIKKIVKQ